MASTERTQQLPATRRMLVGQRNDLDVMIREGHVRAVGKFTQGPAGMAAVPVVYVSKRAQPFVVRHRIALLVSGGVVLVVGGVVGVIAAIGLGWFMLAVAAMAFSIAILSRITNGGGKRAHVTVTTTTRVGVRR